jgi:hypothetical protein
MDDNQIQVPPSFQALYANASGTRLLQPIALVRARYELCEDLAQMLVDQASTAQFKSGAPEVEVLRAMRDGLRAEGSAVEVAEADWVIERLAELLQWPAPREEN